MSNADFSANHNDEHANGRARHPEALALRAPFRGALGHKTIALVLLLAAAATSLTGCFEENGGDNGLYNACPHC